MTLVIRCLAPSYADYGPGGSRNTLADPDASTQGIISFAIFNLLNLICLWPSPQQIRHLFTVKTIVMPIAGIAFLAWTLAEAKGAGEVLRAPTTLGGSKLAWTWIAAAASCVSNMATLLTNNPDYSRLANKPSAVFLPQLLAIPGTFAITSLVGILITSASTLIYDKGPQWNPLDVLGLKLDADPYNASSRAGVFFLAAAFIIAQLGTNVAANSLSAGHDLAALFPKYVSIRRGQILCWAVGFAYGPWRIMSSSSNFATYLSAFSVFLSSIVGVMVADYWIVRRGALDVKSLYSLRSTDGGESLYYYTAGINWRAYAAYLIGLAINMPGFIGVCRGKSISQSIDNMYTLSFFLGFFLSFLVYLALNRFFPVTDAVPFSKEEKRTWREPAGKSWEALDWSVPVYADEALPAYSSSASVGRMDEEDGGSSFAEEEKKSSSRRTSSGKPTITNLDY